MSKLWTIFMIAVLLSGCERMKPGDYADNEPTLVLEDYFAGRTRAWGIFEDRFGNLRRQFTVDIDGVWDGSVLTLDERFLYDDGERDRRVWRLVKTGERTYEGTAADVVGAAHGETGGNAFNFRYRLDMKVGDGTWRVDFDDWMYLQPDGVLLNRAKVSKFGFELGVVTIAFSKPERLAANDRSMISEFAGGFEYAAAANR